MTNRTDIEQDEDEVENEVFRNQFIPQSLHDVHDLDRQSEQRGGVGTGNATFKGLLAEDKSRMQTNDDSDGKGSGPGPDDDSDADEDSDRESETKPPRGKRFQDKDAKKEHKKQVKEEKREKRKEKMPKYVKNKLVNSTSKPKH